MSDIHVVVTVGAHGKQLNAAFHELVDDRRSDDVHRACDHRVAAVGENGGAFIEPMLEKLHVELLAEALEAHDVVFLDAV